MEPAGGMTPQSGPDEGPDPSVDGPKATDGAAGLLEALPSLGLAEAVATASALLRTGVSPEHDAIRGVVRRARELADTPDDEDLEVGDNDMYILVTRNGAVRARGREHLEALVIDTTREQERERTGGYAADGNPHCRYRYRDAPPP
jgi:hypothetical protein